MPRVYRELVSQHVLYGDGIRLSRTPVDIVSDDDVEWLVALINNPRRERDIIALSSDTDGVCIVNPNIFADRLCGVSHVVRIYPDASFKLSDTIGKYLSIFDLGIRIYRPTSQIEVDDPLRHTLYTKRTLMRFDIERVQHAILSDAFATSLEGALSPRAIPTFARIRSARATLKLAELQANVGSKGADLLESELSASETARLAAEAQAREALDIAIQEESRPEGRGGSAQSGKSPRDGIGRKSPCARISPRSSRGRPKPQRLQRNSRLGGRSIRRPNDIACESAPRTQGRSVC